MNDPLSLGLAGSPPTFKGRLPRPKSVPVPPGPKEPGDDYKQMLGKAASSVDQVISYIEQASDLYPRGAPDWRNLIRNLERIKKALTDG